MKLTPGQTPLMPYVNPCTTPRGTVNTQDPTPPAGLTTSEAYRWITAHRHLEAAKQTDINQLDAAGRKRHFSRVCETVDDLLNLCKELSQRRATRPITGSEDVL